LISIEASAVYNSWNLFQNSLNGSINKKLVRREYDEIM
jgi:hypothetical protein